MDAITQPVAPPHLETSDMIPILVTTKHRGVFYGLVPEDSDLTQTTMALTGARMAIRWGTTGGVAQLAESGPTNNSRIGSRADLPALHDITAVWSVTPKAQAKWESA